MIGQTIGRYRILEEIGRGGMGVVYRARDEHFRRDVALKLLPPSTLANLASRRGTRREALALSRLSHPAVVVVHDLIALPEHDCIVMELVGGEPLDRILSRGALAEAEALRLGAQLAQGLAAAHRAGVIHRDLKPANLRVTADGWLKIVDFGLAKRTPESGETAEADSTVSGAVVGTVRYVAPEVWRGELASEASDLYAAGVILYEMATGLHPFHDLGSGGIAKATIAFDPPTPRRRNPAISEEFEAIILSCLEKDPARRMPSADALTHALEPLAARHRHAVPDPVRTRRSLPVPRWVIGTGAAWVLAVAVIAIGRPQGWWGRVGETPPIRSLVVLPLANLSGDPAEEYFVDGMTDELISSLAEYSSLRVISRTTAMHYKGTTETLPSIARELNVDAVVQGSVKLSGNRARFSFQLIDGRQDRQLWNKRYGGHRHSAPEIHGRVAKSIAREIGLLPGEGDRESRADAAHPDPIAYPLYLQGRFHWSRRNADGIRRAIAYFGSAIRNDSLYAPAYSGLADAWATAGISGTVPSGTAYPQAKRAALRAVELDSLLSEGYVSLGNIQQNFDWDWDGAARAYRRAIELNENNAVAHHWYANHLALQGEFDGAMVEIRRAQDLDPLAMPINVGAGAFLYYARRYEEALREYGHAIELDSSSADVNRAMAATLIQLGREQEAAGAIQRWLDGSYPGELADRAAVNYRRAGLRGMLRVLVGALQGRRKAGHYEPATQIAALHALIGERDLALDWLAVALREQDPQLNRLRVDPIFDPLRGDPRFSGLLRSIGLSPPS